MIDDDPATYNCTCSTGISGSDCEITPCTTNPCKNGGVCDFDSSGNFSCSCLEGYFGNTCEGFVCDPNPCENNGTCHVYQG